MLIHPGTQERVIKEVTVGAGQTTKEGSIQSDSLLVSLWVDSVTSGDLTLTVVTLTGEGKESDEIISFPTVSAGTLKLLLKKAAISLQRFKVIVNYTGVCEYEVYVRAVEGSGEASVRIIGPAELVTSAEIVTVTPGVLLAPSLTDRQGLIIKNFQGTGILYVSEDQAKLPDQAWPITPGETFFLDVASGVTLYAVSSSGDLDVRIAEAGE